MARGIKKSVGSVAAHRLIEPGGPGGIRTLDPHNAIVVRSQLRYRPKTY